MVTYAVVVVSCTTVLAGRTLKLVAVAVAVAVAIKVEVCVNEEAGRVVVIRLVLITVLAG